MTWKSIQASISGQSRTSAPADPDLFLGRSAARIMGAEDPSQEMVQAYREELMREHEQLRLMRGISNALMKYLDTKKLDRKSVV